MPNASVGSQISSSSQVNPGTIQGSDIANLTITGANVANNTLADTKLSDGLTVKPATGAPFYYADSGTASAWAITTGLSIGSYTAGQTWRIKLANSVTGATTLAVDGLAAKTVLKAGGTALASGDFISGQVVEVVYDGTNFQMNTPPAGGLGNTAVYGTGTVVASAPTERSGTAVSDTEVKKFTIATAGYYTMTGQGKNTGGGGATWVGTVYKNGSTTGVSASINNTVYQAYSMTAVQCNAGDTLSLYYKITGGGTGYTYNCALDCVVKPTATVSID